MLGHVGAFVTDMGSLGLNPTIDNGLVLYHITPIDGALAGTVVETGVAIDELDNWPQAPPHWLHFPESIRFSRTNAEISTRSGWLKHSRNISGWGDSPPASGWASHVRAVLSEVTL